MSLIPQEPSPFRPENQSPGLPPSAEPAYTQAELDEFRKLVKAAESLRQMDRIHARIEQPKFIARVGKEKCDAMFEVLKKELR